MCVCVSTGPLNFFWYMLWALIYFSRGQGLFIFDFGFFLGNTFDIFQQLLSFPTKEKQLLSSIARPQEKKMVLPSICR